MGTLLLFCLPLAIGAQPASEPIPSPPEIYRHLLALKPDPDRVARVDGLVLVREDARFQLQEGYLALGRPLFGRVQAAFFWGSGRFTFSPRDTLEKANLQRLFGTDTLRLPFRQLYLFFDDTTLQELTSQLRFSGGKVASSVTADLKYVFKYLESSQREHLPVAFVRSLLDSTASGLFYAHFSEAVFEPYFFEINPYSEESVRFYRRDLSTSVRYLKEIVCQYPAGKRAGSGADLDVLNYHIAVQIDPGLNFSARVQLCARLLPESERWIYFWLQPDIEVEAVSDSTGRPWPFWKGDNSALLWIQRPQSPSSDRPLCLTVKLHSKRLLERRGDWILLRSSSNWYPRHRFEDRATYQLEFTVPKQLELVAVGGLVDSAVVDSRRRMRWETEGPVRAVSFNLGEFRRRIFRLPGLPPVEVLLSPRAHFNAGRSLLRFRVLSGRHMDVQVGRDVVQSLRFFTRRFGPLSVPRLVVSEIPTFSGEAFPGFIQLSWETFQFTEKTGLDAIFRAHEVAHQWWGIAVAHASYHDQWISEGLSEFSALLYLERLKGRARYLKALAGWRKQILGARRSFLSRGMPPGSLWLGIRNESYQTRGDFYLVVHKKGAWVFHMLRMLLMDPVSENDSLFTDLLRRLYHRFQGRRVSTAALQALVEEVSGQPMDWFFRQWVYGYRIPAYRWASRIQARPDGRFNVQFRVIEETGSVPFRVPVLIRLVLNDGRSVRVRHWLEAGQTRFQIADLPARPVKIVMNDLESVLARFHKVGW